MSLVLFGLLPWLVVLIGCWLGYQLLRQNGRMLLRLETIEQRLDQLSQKDTPHAKPKPQPPSGLPIGSPAPAFELPDLLGARRSLEEFRGQRLLLIFFNPRCGFCTRMAPALAALPAEGAADRPLPLLITTGDPEENRQLVQEHELSCPVLLQQQMEIASEYAAHGTPMGCLIDAEGRIASELAVGAQALLALAQPSAPGDPEPSAHDQSRKSHRGNRSLAQSHLNRQGLPAGTPAPGFRLPRLDGGEVSLEEYRGERVLLVFSDPGCGPCNPLSPQLEQFHRRSAEIRILMISRGDPEANRAKVLEHGLTFPVVLQRQWEISRQYAMFATPIAYLIDEAGVITADVAVGMEPIMALLSSQAPIDGRAAPRRCRCGKLAAECHCVTREIVRQP